MTTTEYEFASFVIIDINEDTKNHTKFGHKLDTSGAHNKNHLDNRH